MNVTDVICCILANCQFGLWTLWGRHRRAETCRSIERPDGCDRHVCNCLVL